LAVAFVLLSAEPGIEKQVLEEVKKIPHVTDAHIVFGIYDILAKVEAHTMAEVKETITREIRLLDHIEGTLTLLVADSAQSSDPVPSVALRS
jgi:DNA-binding Lrp family transcriptional regulator